MVRNRMMPVHGMEKFLGQKRTHLCSRWGQVLALTDTLVLGRGYEGQLGCQEFPV